ncbi:MAG: RNA methyltransferase [Syntrophobacteraceae bacterium]|nr:RNA methyltransferase [Syntrophobacteraceae bacterium]
MGRLYLALAHYPVLNRVGETIASAITNLDLHDLARSCCTFGVPACYIVTPLKDQQGLAGRLTKHWIEGVGGEILPERREALKLLQVVESIPAAIEDLVRRDGKLPVLWATSAKTKGNGLAHARARQLLENEDRSFLLILGTGWGLAPEVFDIVDAVLEPIAGANGYNHLPVRSAASILMDRLLGRPN